MRPSQHKYESYCMMCFFDTNKNWLLSYEGSPRSTMMCLKERKSQFVQAKAWDENKKNRRI